MASSSRQRAVQANLDDARSEKLDTVFRAIQAGGMTFGGFLREAFTVPPPQVSKGNTARHSQLVSAFLGGRSSESAHEIVELMYSSRYSAPIPVRDSPRRPGHEAPRPDAKKMARWGLREWAVEKVEDIVDEEAEDVTSKAGGFHLRDKDATWDFMFSFTMENILSVINARVPTTLCVITAAAIPRRVRKPPGAPQDASATFCGTYYSKEPDSNGDRGKRRDPMLITLIACLLLFGARNLQFTAFQKFIGIWLFAHTASSDIYAVFSRFGVSVSYSSVLRLLRSLSQSAQMVIQRVATARAFLLIYDNINRMARAWDPDVGEHDIMHNGTAATLVELEDCDPKVAFDPETLRRAQGEQLRRNLHVNVLHGRVDWWKLNAVMTTHILGILAEHVPEHLSAVKDFVKLRLSTTLATHRMRDGRKTKLHPLATSDYNEGVTSENAKVLDDLLLHQLGLPKEEVDKLLVIVGGDQSTVEKLRTLKKFLASCPHGYKRYGWVLPLIQLWHMGWADLERILSTHWGASQSDAKDLSSLCAMNVLLGRKVKDQKRPDYYPTQHLLFDTLKADILSIWRIRLGVKDLPAYFSTHTVPTEELLQVAEDIRLTYCTSAAWEEAVLPDDDSMATVSFPIGAAWQAPDGTDGTPAMATVAGLQDNALSSNRGDQVLGNIILRTRDILLHYEFQCAIAEGDIGRAMNVMSVWTFTFMGSGRHKYVNELLELTCHFEYEYSGELQKAILNNWLCNLSGFAGCWFPMDLLQEKNIKQLKEMAQRRSASFGGSFFKEVIAYNIRAFLQTITSARVTAHLASKSAKHARKDKHATLNELSRHMDEQGLHQFRAGRTLGHVAQDDFTEGYRKLADGKKIEDFIARTLRDAGAIHSDSELAAADDEQQAIDTAALPNVVVDGQLLVGDEVMLDGLDSGEEEEQEEQDNDTT